MIKCSEGEPYSTEGCYITTALLAIFPALAFIAPSLRTELGPIPIYAVDILAAVIIVWAFANGKYKILLPNRQYVGLFTAFVFLAVPGIIQGLTLSHFSILYVYTTGRLLLNVAAPLAIISLIRTRRQIAATVSGLIVGLVVVSTIGILQILPNTQSYVISALSWYYPASSFVQWRLAHHSYAFATWHTATPYAGILAMGAVFPMILWFRKTNWQLLVALGIALLAFVLAESRSPVIALAPVLAFILSQAVSRRLATVLISGGVIFLAGMELVGIQPSPTTLFTNFVVLFQQFSESNSIGTRIQSYYLFFDFFATHPVRTTMGFGPDVSSIVGRGSGSEILSNAVKSTPITSLLAPIIQFGIAGTFAYFGILVYSIRSGFGFLSTIDYDVLGDLSFQDAVVYAATTSLVVGLFLHPFDQYFIRGGIRARYLLWTIMAVQQAAIHYND